MKTQIVRDVTPYEMGYRVNRNAFIFSIKQSDKRMLNVESGGNTTLRNVNNCVTNSGEQNPSREATISSASQEILWILRDPKVHYRIHRRLSPVHILCQSNPVHASPSHFLVIYFNIIFSKTSVIIHKSTWRNIPGDSESYSVTPNWEVQSSHTKSWWALCMYSLVNSICSLVCFYIDIKQQSFETC